MTIKQVVFALILAFLSAGCMAEKEFASGELSESLIYSYGIRGGMDIEILDFKIDEPYKTTPVHTDDSRFLSGDTTVDIEEDRWENPNLVLYVGPNFRVGTEDIQLVSGFALRFNMGGEDEYQEGYYGVEQQSSDTRGGWGSFNYTRAEIGLLTLEPDIGIRCQNEDLWAEFRIGFPYSQFECESGWDRWGKWQKYQSESWEGFGQRLSVTIGGISNNEIDADIALRAYVIKYDTSFGEVTGGGGNLVFSW